MLMAANRDERFERAWDPPAAWWPDRPGVIAGRDRTAGGTWMAVNRHGVVAAVLNRPGSLGPSAGHRSRGELPLLALDADTADAAAAILVKVPAAEWRPFNLVVADPARAWFLRGTGAGRPSARVLPDGISMVTAHDPNDLASPRTARHLPRFHAAAPPCPDRNDWAEWETLLADADHPGGLAETLRVPPTDGFGTVCSSLLALRADGVVRWRFAAGPAGDAPFRDLPAPA